MLSEVDEDHYNPTVRLIEIERNHSSCGFKLTRGKWDPYPWVVSVENGTAAQLAGMKQGDCLLEVNGEDVVGLRISEIAEIVKSKSGQISLLLWNAGIDTHCTPEALCCGPMPINLQRLSACMSTILAILECPVCLDSIQPPTYQCDNGHLICIRCRAKSERCPVCRLRFTRGRSLLADQVYNSLIEAFDLKEEPEESRSAKIQHIFKLRKNKNVPDIKITQSHTNKFLAKLIGKSSSVDNLSSNTKFLSPNTSRENGLNTNLKTKSLSTNEIFQHDSPEVSRSGSVNRLSRNLNKPLNINDDDDRPASYHGSYECLQRKIDADSHTCFEHDENVLYHCPFLSSCNSLINETNIMEHFQISHEGPLVQFFNNNIKINLKRIIEETNICYIVNYEGNIFFLKINLQQQSEERLSKDILLWIWYLGSKKISKEYEMQMELTNATMVLLSVRNSVFSLNSVTEQEIIGSKKGVFLSGKTLDLLDCKNNNFNIDIKILKTDVE